MPSAVRCKTPAIDLPSATMSNERAQGTGRPSQGTHRIVLPSRAHAPRHHPRFLTRNGPSPGLLNRAPARHAGPPKWTLRESLRRSAVA
ncbi:hypothetical protein GCM10010341_90360 [Streptomyces noursei]|nr:hypothetical protein GCM10010341_90360 [Streptomyces noursei]